MPEVAFVSYAKTLACIEKQVTLLGVPSVTKISKKKDPFIVLVSCILSLRTKDAVTEAASRRLFAKATTASDLLRARVSQIEKLIYPVGFYRTKARTLHSLAKMLVTRYEGRVPSTKGELLALKGVGLKTANLVLGLGFGINAICVDTHVHRICNRLGWICTKVPHETERALCRKLPSKIWIKLNTLLVTFGQNICTPVSPFCSRCSVRKWCKRVGVKRSR